VRNLKGRNFKSFVSGEKSVAGEKGVAVPYIIALILGIAVVALLGYWFFVLGGRLGGESIAAECEAKLTSYCQAWKTLGYSTARPTTQDWARCSMYVAGTEPAKTECAKYVPE
jgi:hypothetical protein